MVSLHLFSLVKPFKFSVCCQYNGQGPIFLVDKGYHCSFSFTLLDIVKNTLGNGFYRRMFSKQCQLYKLQISCLVLKFKNKTP